MDTNCDFQDGDRPVLDRETLHKMMVADLNQKVREAGEIALRLHRIRGIGTVHSTPESVSDMSQMVVVPNHMKSEWDRSISHCEAPRHEEKVLYRHPPEGYPAPVAVSGKRMYMSPSPDDFREATSSVHLVDAAGGRKYIMMGHVLARQPPKPLSQADGDQVVAWQGGFAVRRSTGKVEASGRGAPAIMAALATEPPVTAVAATRDSLFCGHLNGTTSQHHPKAISHNPMIQVRSESVVADTSIASTEDRRWSRVDTPVRALIPFSCGIAAIHDGARARCFGYEFGDLPSDDTDRTPLSKSLVMHRIDRKLSWMGGVDEVSAEEADGTALVVGHKNHKTVIHFDPHARSWDAEMVIIQLPPRSEIIWHPYNSTDLSNHHIAIAPRSVHVFCLKNPDEIPRRKGRATVNNECLDKLREIPLSWWSSYIIRGVTYPSGGVVNPDSSSASLLIPKGLSHLDDLVILSQI